MQITNTSDKPVYYFSLFIMMPGVKVAVCAEVGLYEAK